MATRNRITIDGDADISPLLALFEDPEKRRQLNLRGARAVQEFMRKYHRAFEGSRGWVNPALPTHGAGRKRSRFGESIVRGWSKIEATEKSADIINTDARLSHKVTGGTIRAKRAKALTIPVDPRAHAQTTRQFESATGFRLFRPRGKNYLATTEDGVFKVIYLLRASVTQKPWKGALPPAVDILGAFAGEIRKAIGEAI